MISEYLFALFLTLTIESLLFLLLTRKSIPPGKALLSCFAANLVTHPLVWFAFPVLGPYIGYPAQIAVSELFAFSAEALIYTQLLRPMRLEEAAAISLICNLASFAIGLAI